MYSDFVVKFHVLKSTNLLRLVKLVEMILNIVNQCPESREQFRIPKCCDLLVFGKNVWVFFEVFSQDFLVPLSVHQPNQ